MPTCLVIQHVEPEGPHLLGSDLVDRGLELQICRTYLGDAVPDDTSGLAALVVMGGPTSAHDDTGFPTRRAEIALLEDALRRGTPTIGICLGAQLLAVAGGGTAFPGAGGPEIGWAPVALTAEARTDALLAGSPAELDVLHWHGDTFTLPPTAVRLAGSTRYENQAFALGPAWGLQFHLEADEAAVLSFVTAFADELDRAGISGGAIAVATGDAVRRLAPWRRGIFTRFADLAWAYATSQAAEV